TGVTQTYHTYDELGEVVHYKINVGELGANWRKAVNRIYFINDHDVASPTGNSWFGNIKVYEQGDVVSTKYVYDDLGRVRYTIDAESYVSENVYDANGNVIETKRYKKPIIAESAVSEYDVQRLLAATKNQDFASNTNGFVINGTPAGSVVRENNKVTLKGEKLEEGSSNYYPGIFGNSEASSVGSVYRLEVTAEQLSGQEYLMVKMDNSKGWSDPAYRLSGIYFRSGNIQSYHRENAQSGAHTLGQYEEGKTYVVEIEIVAGGTINRVYEKGNREATVLEKRTSMTDFGTTRLATHIWSGPESSDYIWSADNYVEYDVNATPESTSTKYVYDALGRVRYTIDGEGYVSENFYDANGNVIETKRYENIDASAFKTDSNYISRASQINNIQVYDASPEGATITSVFDDEKGHDVIQLTGEGTSNGYRVKTEGMANWNNVDQRVLSWEMKYSEGYTIYISVDTDKGHRYLTYTAGDRTPTLSESGYAYLGLPVETKQGEWQTVQRDLAADLALVEPDNVIRDVNAFLIRGSGRLDNITLKGGVTESDMNRFISTQNANSISTRYVYDALGRVRYTIDAENYVSENVYDANGNVIETKRYEHPIVSDVDFNSFNQNRLTNSTFDVSSGVDPDGWRQRHWRVDASGQGVQLSDYWSLNDDDAKTYWLRQTGRDPSDSYQELVQDIEVREGEKYIFSAYTGAHRATVSIHIVWFDAEGKSLGSTAEIAASRNVTEKSGGQSLSGYKRIVAQGEAPEGAVKGQLLLRKRNTNEGSNDSYMFVVKPQLEVVSLEQTTPSKWVENHLEHQDEYVSTKYVYDALGRVRYTIDPENYVSENVYDANGNVSTTRRYSDAIVFDPGYSAQQLSVLLSRSVTLTKPVNVEVNGNTIKKISGSAGAYDAAAYSIESIANGEGALRFKVPSMSSRVLVGLNDNGAASNSYGDMEFTIFIINDDVHVYEDGSHRFNFSNNHTEGNEYRIKLSNGKALYQVRKAGETGFTTFYTSTKTVDGTKNYHADATLMHMNDRVTGITLDGAGVNNPAAESHFFYDAIGRVRYTIDPENYVSENVYDANGNVISTRRYSDSIVVNQSYTVEQLTALLPNKLTLTKPINTKIDGNSIEKISGSASAYDASAHSIESIKNGEGAFRFKVPSESSRVLVGLNDNGGDSSAYGDMEFTLFIIYDDIYVYEDGSNKFSFLDNHAAGNEYRIKLSNGQALYQVRREGELQFTTFYTSAKTVDGSRSYQADATLMHMSDRITDITIDGSDVSDAVIETLYTYDSLGRVVATQDANGHTEYNTYDAFGNRIQFENKLGHKWTYEYDKRGQLIEEISPQVTVAFNDGTEGTEEIKKRFAYDAYGNVISITEAAGIAGQERTIRYEYDKRGNQTTVINADQGVWSSAQNKVVATGTADTDQTWFNAFGQAVKNKDTEGFYRYKSYTENGKVEYEVDGDGYVTFYQYDARGNVIEVTRYAEELTPAELSILNSKGTDFSSADIKAMVNTSGKDRVITTTYNSLGQKVSVKQSSVAGFNSVTNGAFTDSPETRYEYNSQGQLIKQSTKVSNTQWADSYFYYNNAGQRVATVDPLGYVTQVEYDAFGNVIKQTEYAEKSGSWNESSYSTPTASDKDRAIRFEYDDMNRLVKTVKEGVDVSRIDAGNVLKNSRDVVELVGYDKLGREVSRTDANGGIARTSYDVLGRVESVIEPERLVAKAGALDPFISNGFVMASPVTTFEYNAHGDVISTSKQSNVSSARGEVQETRNIVDFHGNIVKSLDANLNATYTEYNSQGKVTETRQSLDEEEVVTYTPIIRYDEVRVEIDDGVYTTKIVPVYGDPITKESPESYKFTRVQKYEYDSNGNQIKTSINTNVHNEAENFITTVSTYNAFGELYRQGQEGEQNTFTFDYDNAGRLVQTNQGDGVIKAYDYDLVGQKTRENRKGDLSTSLDDRVTYIKYDLLGRAIEHQAPKFTSFANSTNASTGVLTTPRTLQQYDRWGNVTQTKDAANNITKYDFDHANRLIKETKAAVTYWDEKGDGHVGYKATTEHFYDAIGQRIAEKDTLGNFTKYEYDAGGNLRRTTDRLNEITEYAYDIFGRKVATKDALGYVRTNQFDAMGQIIKQGILRNNGGVQYKSGQTTPSGLNEVILTSYEFDSLGQRKVEYMGDYDLTTSRIVTMYKYDTRGNVVLTTKMRDKTLVNNPDLPERRTYYTYDEYGNKTSQEDANGRTQTWVYDNAFGRVKSYTDLGGRETDYFYNLQGDLNKETYTLEGANIDERRYDYWENGALKSITDERKVGSEGTTPRYRTDNFNHTINVDSFSYDILGRQVHVKHLQTQRYAGVEYIEGPGDGGGGGFEPRRLNSEFESFNTTYSTTVIKTIETSSFSQESRTQYDALNRIEKVKSPANTYGNELLSLEKRYDEKGNVRATIGTYKLGGTNTNATRANWHTYNEENRLITVKGRLENQQIVAEEEVAYDALGQRVESTTFKDVYLKEANKEPGYVEYQTISAYRQELYIYDDIGNLEDTKVRAKLDFDAKFGSARTVYGAWLYSKDQVIDDWGRAVHTYNFNQNWKDDGVAFAQFASDSQIASAVLNTKLKDHTNTIYNAINQATLQKNFTYDSNGANKKLSTKVDFTGGYDRAGNQLGYRVYVYRSDGSTVDHSIGYTNQYNYFDSYQLQKQIAKHSKNQSNPGETFYYYDSRRNLTSVYQQDKEDPTKNYWRHYKNTNSGQILNLNQTNKHQTYYYVNGQGVGDIGLLSGVDFDYNLKPFKNQVKQASPSQYVVSRGDTLKAIAATVYGDSSLWYIIANNNGIASDSELVEGMNLNIPPQLTNTNNADTFRPYNPGDIIGDTTPIAIAPPPPKNGCGVLGAIIMVVVMVVVTVYTAGALGPAGASLWSTGTSLLGGSLGFSAATAGAAFAAGVAGSTASQLVGKSMGMVESFSLRQAMSSGMTTVATMGLGYLGQAGEAASTKEAMEAADKVGKVKEAEALRKTLYDFSETVRDASSLAQAAGKALSYGGGAAHAASTVISAVAANKLAGVKDDFRWSNVVSSYVSSQLFGGQNYDEPVDRFLASTGTGVASSYINHKIKKERGESSRWENQMSWANAFGSALANEIVAGLTPKENVSPEAKIVGISAEGLKIRADGGIVQPSGSIVYPYKPGGNNEANLGFEITQERAPSIAPNPNSEADAKIAQVLGYLNQVANGRGDFAAISAMITADEYSFDHDFYKLGGDTALATQYLGGGSDSWLGTSTDKRILNMAIANTDGDFSGMTGRFLAFEEGTSNEQRILAAFDQVGLRASAGQYMDIINQVESGAQFINISDAYFVSEYNSAQELYNNKIYAGMEAYGNMTSDPGHKLLAGIASDYARNFSLAGDAGAPLDLRNGARNSLILDAALTVAGPFAKAAGKFTSMAARAINRASAGMRNLQFPLRFDSVPTMMRQSGSINVTFQGWKKVPNSNRAASSTLHARHVDELALLNRQKLLDELSQKGIKHSPENIVDIRKTQDGKIVFLETGNKQAGLEHILVRHEQDFANVGIHADQIPEAVMTAVTQGKVIGYQGKNQGRTIYETLFNDTRHQISVTVSDNGFIVGANPQSRLSPYITE
ncbi:MAG: RHS repeat protein, partial [Gammaproteobacteria bacterium]|nr:RHS repeat protein [Gammaproteobacteria bacterium]